MDTSLIDNAPLTLEIYNGDGALSGGDSRNRLSIILLSTILDLSSFD